MVARRDWHIAPEREGDYRKREQERERENTEAVNDKGIERDARHTRTKRERARARAITTLLTYPAYEA